MGTPTTYTSETPEALDHDDHERVVVREHRPTTLEMLRSSWQQRSLIGPLGIRRMVKRYAALRLRWAWLFARPIATIFGMTLLFGGVLETPTNGIPYPLFLLGGLLAWTLIERTVIWMTPSVDIYYRVASRFPIPVLLIPISGVTPVVIEWGALGVIAALAAGVYTIIDGEFPLELSEASVLLVPGLALALCVGVSVGLWLATLNTIARDVRLTVRIVLPIWLYVTPVLYAQSTLTGGWELLASLNPAAAPVEMVKRALFDSGPSDLTGLYVSLGATVLLSISGLLFLVHRAPEFLKVPTYDDEEEEEAVA